MLYQGSGTSLSFADCPISNTACGSLSQYVLFGGAIIQTCQYCNTYAFV